MGKFRQFNLVLTAVAQPLSNALPGVEDESVENVGFRQLLFQADDGNSNPIFLGDADLTADSFGFCLPLPPGNVPAPTETLGPFNAGPIKLSEVFALGTADEILNIVGYTY